MKVYFLGTGTSQGIPVIGSTHPVCKSENPKDKRLRVSIWIEINASSIVIDCGPDFRQQMLNSNCQKIDAILFTHEHADHTAGLDDIRPYFFQQGPIPIFAHQRVLQNLAKRFDYIFEETNKYPGAPSVLQNEIIENQPFEINQQLVEPISAFHGSLQVFGFKIANLVYLTDVKSIANEQIEKIKHCNILIINCLREEPHPTHFNLDEALHFVSLVQPKQTFFTHISHHFGFHDEIELKLPKNVYLAYDNLILNI